MNVLCKIFYLTSHMEKIMQNNNCWQGWGETGIIIHYLGRGWWMGIWSDIASLENNMSVLYKVKRISTK